MTDLCTEIVIWMFPCSRRLLYTAEGCCSLPRTLWQPVQLAGCQSRYRRFASAACYVESFRLDPLYRSRMAGDGCSCHLASPWLAPTSGALKWAARLYMDAHIWFWWIWNPGCKDCKRSLHGCKDCKRSLHGCKDCKRSLQHTILSLSVYYYIVIDIYLKIISISYKIHISEYIVYKSKIY